MQKHSQQNKEKIVRHTRSVQQYQDSAPMPRHTDSAATASLLNELNRSFYEKVALSFSATRQHPWTGWKTLVACINADTPAFPGTPDTSDTSHTLDTPNVSSGSSTSSVSSISAPHVHKGAEIPTKPLPHRAPHSSLAQKNEFRVLDLGSGNGRFERFFLECVRPDIAQVASFVCIDSAGELLKEAADIAPSISCYKRDVQELLEQEITDTSIFATSSDLSVSFGVTHHLFSYKRRLLFLLFLTGTLKKGGRAALSFWQPEKNERLRRQIKTTEAAARASSPLLQEISLEEGDGFLRWQERTDVFRYVHSFSDDEITKLLDDVLARDTKIYVEKRYTPQSGNDILNTYVILRRTN